MAINIDLRGESSPPIDTAAIASGLRSTLRANGWKLVEGDIANVPLVYFGVLVSEVSISAPSPSTFYAIRYEYTLTENVKLIPPQHGIVPASVWSAGGGIEVANRGEVSGSIRKMGELLSRKLNVARGPVL